MAYKITCDNYPILDLRDDDLIVVDPKVNLEVNKVGEGSFTIYSDHPYFSKLQRMKSVFEVSDDVGVIFRGRMTDDTMDFDNGKAVDIEGAMAFFNDSIVRPFVFPDDFLENADYITAAESGNVVKFFLKWLIDGHNEQVTEAQRFKLGKVTVTDPNNYITRSNSSYDTTWANLDSRLFNSSLGGYLCIRYEADGNYIDYLAEFDETNPQEIVYGENLLNLSNETTAAETYSAIIPLGKETEQKTGNSYEGDYVEIVDSVKKRLTLESLEDGNITDDLVKRGDVLYSKSAVASYGWICKPVDFEDVTDVNNLLTKAIDQLTTDGIMLSNTIEAKAVDLHFSDADVQSFRMYRNVVVHSVPHNLSASYQLSKLSIPLLDPKNTNIVVGKTQKTLLDKQIENANNALSQVIKIKETIESDVSGVKQDVSDVKIEVTEVKQSVSVVSDEINGLKQRVDDTEGNVSELQQKAGEFSVAVENIEGDVSKLQQTADGFSTTVGNMQNEISEIKQTAGQVRVVVSNDDGTLSSIINPEEISITRLDEDGNVESGFYYDADAGDFKFFGSGEFRSSNGSIYYMRLEGDEIILYAGDLDKIHIGVQSGTDPTGTDVVDYPYILMGSDAGDNVGLMKKFYNGMWYGNSAPKNITGNFEGCAEASGMFVDTRKNKAYVVDGTEMKNLYTGEAVARFA